MQAIPVRTPELTLSLEQDTWTRPRLYSVDLLRGLVMVLMALDHVRVWFSGIRYEPTDLSRVNRAFFTANGVIGIVLFVFALADLVLLQGLKG